VVGGGGGGVVGGGGVLVGGGVQSKNLDSIVILWICFGGGVTIEKKL